MNFYGDTCRRGAIRATNASPNFGGFFHLGANKGKIVFIGTRRLDIHNNRIFPLVGQNRCIAAVFAIKHANITVHHRLDSVDSWSQSDGIFSFKIGFDLSYVIHALLPCRKNPYQRTGHSGSIQGNNAR